MAVATAIVGFSPICCEAWVGFEVPGASRQIDVGYWDNKQHPTARCTEVRACDGRIFRARTSSSAGATWSRSTSILREAPLMSAIRRSVARSRVEVADNIEPWEWVAQSAGFHILGCPAGNRLESIISKMKVQKKPVQM